MRRNCTKKVRGFTLTEIALTLAIIGIVSGLVIATLTGSLSRDDVDRATQGIYDDLIYMRSRAISTNLNHRLNFTADNQWKIESQDATTLVWSAVTDTRKMNTNTNLTSTTYTNAGTNLWATPRGLYSFQGSSSGAPYVTITTLGAGKTKSINVDVGGAVDIIIN